MARGLRGRTRNSLASLPPTICPEPARGLANCALHVLILSALADFLREIAGTNGGGDSVLACSAREGVNRPREIDPVPVPVLVGIRSECPDCSQRAGISAGPLHAEACSFLASLLDLLSNPGNEPRCLRVHRAFRFDQPDEGYRPVKTSS